MGAQGAQWWAVLVCGRASYFCKYDSGGCREDPVCGIWSRGGSTKIGLPVREQLEQAGREWTKAWTESVQGMGRRREAQFSSVTQSCPTLCDPMNRSTPGLPVHHQLPEFTQTHVRRVGDAIQPSHPLSSPSPPAPNPSQHQSLFQ